ncbi:MAG: serine/threonine protein kinase [Myxococcales bacterium]|nr:serine/threonine protein kinase [Myxococcales bacterium]
MTSATDSLEDLAPREDPYLGATLARRYRVLRRLGGGGMGTVYEAEHLVIGRRVAVKLLHPQLAADAATVRRFLNEARAAAMIGHPNILECTDMGQADDGAPFLVLDLLRGDALDEVIRREGVLPVARAVRIALQIAGALGAAHEKGIVHRDLKPDNVFLLRGDDVRVLDFGISKFASLDQSGVGTKTGSILGTPYYMAPEQFRDASRVDARADVYALGVILYECLSGRVPFQASTLPELALMIAADSPARLDTIRTDLPAELVDVVMRAMEKAPNARFASMDELAGAIGPFAQDTTAAGLSLADTVAARSPVPGRVDERASRASSRSRIAAFAVVVTALVFAGVAVVARRTPAERPSANASDVVADADEVSADDVGDDLAGDVPAGVALAGAPAGLTGEPLPLLDYRTVVADLEGHLGAVVELEATIVATDERASEPRVLVVVVADGCGGERACVLALADTPRLEDRSAVRVEGVLEGTHVYPTVGGEERVIPLLRVRRLERLEGLRAPEIVRAEAPLLGAAPATRPARGGAGRARPPTPPVEAPPMRPSEVSLRPVVSSDEI